MKLPWTNIFYPPPAPPGFGAGKVLPEQNASWLSRVTLHWVTAFLDVGFSRPLEKEDFWELPPTRHAAAVTDALERNFYARCPPEKRPLFMRDVATEVTPPITTDEEKAEYVVDPGSAPPKTTPTPTAAPVYDESLFKALLQTFGRRIYGSGLLLLVSDTLRTTSPLVNKVFLTWLTDSYVYAHLSDSERALAASQGFTKPRGVGYGIGLAFAIYVVQESASIMTNHFTLASMTTGLYGRSSVISNIFRKSLRLSGKSRAEHSVGKITTMISTDAERVDSVGYLGHYLWEAPIQLAIALGLLIGTIGYSALVGLAVLIVGMPFQFILVTIMINQRQKCVQITDRRVRLTNEVLQGIRLIKAYGWEAFYTHQIINLRVQEVSRIKKGSIAAAMLIAMFYFLPVVASVVAFITYSATGHTLSIAKVFTALQLFNVMRVPLLMFPVCLSALADAMVSFGRICTFLTAEELTATYEIVPSQSLAVHVDGDFEWETTLKLEATNEETKTDTTEIARRGSKKKTIEEKAKKEKQKEEKPKANRWRRKKAQTNEGDEVVLPTTTNDVAPEKEKEDTVEEEKPFGLRNLRLDVKKGAFVAIVGRVGSGKSSILQALIGEMRRSRGKVVFNDSVAYFTQSPWIKNATVQENITFGQAYNDERFHQVVQACSLEHDLEMLPHGVNTEIGEKGITLSGGQKARISLARAAYSPSGIVLLDDPLAAVDSHVGKHVLENCLLQGPLAQRTRILVTHSLHILDKTDYIYVMDNGQIVEEGTYDDLCSSGAAFSRLIEEHGNVASEKQVGANLLQQQVQIKKKNSDDATALMQEEERNTGAVEWDVYKKYLRSAGGLIWAPIILALLLIVEGNNVFTTLFLGFWSGQTIHNFTNGDYMAVYGGLGAALALSTFLLTYAFLMAGILASLNLYRTALSGVLNSRVSFFDTTPIGRIISRMSKDQDTIDSILPNTFMQFLQTFFSVIGTVGLVFYTFPYLGIIFLPLALLYYGASVYYRRSSVETKRLDSLLRSILYGSYSETLTGLPTIRAYGMQTRSVKDAEHGLDMENRAFLMTILSQRWLALRLEFFANALVLGIGLFGAGFRNSVNPARISVVLSYTLSATQVFSEMISLFAQSEQSMNAVERILHYAELPAEEKNAVASIEPAEAWPADGSIRFHGVKLAYREGLPIVLKGISFDIHAGEKVGIVGRTGSGKSSIIQALLRLVEPLEGKVGIDGLDISTIGLHALRTRIAFVPQDTTLFLGTLRDNLDPEKLRTDAELIAILQQVSLLSKDGSIDPAVEAKFSLDSTVGDEGSNYSAGEKQLLALCRALVKKSRIIILDEATSSVDVETDSKIQLTIQAEFKDSTLLCIAHRLNTVAHYDRILVMDDGKVAEFDSVLTLFDRPDSLFRSLCNEAQLTRAVIVKLRAEHASR